MTPPSQQLCSQVSRDVSVEILISAFCDVFLSYASTCHSLSEAMAEGYQNPAHRHISKLGTAYGTADWQHTQREEMCTKLNALQMPLSYRWM